MTTNDETPTRRTKRRYAYELYPHAEEGETRPLTVEVPYLYAQAIGLDVWRTGWSNQPVRESVDRTMQLVEARRLALLADALLQGMAGDEAWAWADGRGWDESGEWAYERAEHYGVPVPRIKPYPCGAEPDPHDHLSEPDARGFAVVTRTPGKESDCPDCTEPVVP